MYPNIHNANSLGVIVKTGRRHIKLEDATSHSILFAFLAISCVEHFHYTCQHIAYSCPERSLNPNLPHSIPSQPDEGSKEVLMGKESPSYYPARYLVALAIFPHYVFTGVKPRI